MDTKFKIRDEVYFIDNCWVCSPTIIKGKIKGIIIDDCGVTYKIEEIINEVPEIKVKYDLVNDYTGTHTATTSYTTCRTPREYKYKENEISDSLTDLLVQLLADEYEHHKQRVEDIIKLAVNVK